MMEDNARIQYLFLNLHYRTYLYMQTAIIAALVAGAVVFFLFTRDHSFWWLAQAWWICLLAAALEVAETGLALRRAKRPHSEGDNGDHEGS